MSNSVDINVGAKCTASCKHCCFSCTPDSLECLSDKEIDGILDYIESNKDVMSVSITGGEPLLRFEKVKEIIRRCHDAQKTVSLVTNGFLGKNLETAMSITKELKKCGLDIMTLSYDDYHKEYIPPQYISNAGKYYEVPVNESNCKNFEKISWDIKENYHSFLLLCIYWGAFIVLTMMNIYMSVVASIIDKVLIEEFFLALMTYLFLFIIFHELRHLYMLHIMGRKPNKIGFKFNYIFPAF